MPAILRIIGVFLLGAAVALPGHALAEQPTPEAVFAALGMGPEQTVELNRGQPVGYALEEGSADELGVGVAWYVPVPVAEVVKPLRRDDPDLLDVDVEAYGMLSEHGGAAGLAALKLPGEEAEALLEAGPGDHFNLSAHEIEALKKLKHSSHKSLVETVSQHYREILFQRFESYRHGGAAAIAAYAREDTLDSKPSLELHLAANENPLLSRYSPALHKAWLDYPKAGLPLGVTESFPWVEKEVEGRPAAILRHRLSTDWNGGYLVLTREFYATHSYNSSQWLTGCIPYRSGTVVFQQVRSYTDQVAGMGSEVKHVVGRELLKSKMLKAFERLCVALGRCH